MIVAILTFVEDYGTHLRVDARLAEVGVCHRPHRAIVLDTSFDETHAVSEFMLTDGGCSFVLHDTADGDDTRLIGASVSLLG